VWPEPSPPRLLSPRVGPLSKLGPTLASMVGNVPPTEASSLPQAAMVTAALVATAKTVHKRMLHLSQLFTVRDLPTAHNAE